MTYLDYNSGHIDVPPTNINIPKHNPLEYNRLTHSDVTELKHFENVIAGTSHEHHGISYHQQV